MGFVCGRNAWNAITFLGQTEERAKEISQAQLRMVLEGIDFWNAHQKLAIPRCYNSLEILGPHAILRRHDGRPPRRFPTTSMSYTD